MRKCFLALAVLFTCIAANAQRLNPAIESLQRKLTNARTAKERVKALGDLSKVFINQNFHLSDSVGRLMIQEAELSRDRELMAEALLVNGERNSFFAGRRENFDKAVNYYESALELSRQNKLNRYIARSYLALSAVYRVLPDADKAFAYVNEAISYVDITGDDSLSTIAHIELGNVYGLKRQKLLSFRNYLTSMRKAEEIGDPKLKRTCYNALSNFYTSIDEHDKAIDFLTRSLRLIDEVTDSGYIYQKPIALNSIGTLYGLKKNYEMANYFLQESLRVSDSLGYDPLKIPAYLAILNNYLLSGKPQVALDYLNKNEEVKAYTARFGLAYQLDYAYGYIYTDMGRFDSARYYYTKAAPFYESNSTEATKYVFYYQVGRMLKLAGSVNEAIASFQKAEQVAYSVADPERVKLTAKELDTLFQLTNDYKSSRRYAAIYYQYKDSIEKLGKEKDLLQEETADEQLRLASRLKQEREAKQRKNNIQYSAITIGIAALLVIMVVLGMFKVSAGFIKAVGFFFFIMLFEFIFLVFKKKIYSVTNGEPLKDLAFMIGLAAVLVPLHHWVEHKVLHYLTSHNRLTAAGHHLKKKFLRRSKTTEG
ncbi:MAG: tetratricopeptide repeat protein [Chitinophagaceae bacterium]|nr:tetratricopeptide repeat protein [Chitinophagaceae bacterium]